MVINLMRFDVHFCQTKAWYTKYDRPDSIFSRLCVNRFQTLMWDASKMVFSYRFCFLTFAQVIKFPLFLNRYFVHTYTPFYEVFVIFDNSCIYTALSTFLSGPNFY